MGSASATPWRLRGSSAAVEDHDLTAPWIGYGKPPEELLGGHRGDAGQGRLCQRIAARSAGTQDLVQQVGLLLVHLCHLLGQAVGVLVVAHAAVRDTGHAHPLLLCLLHQMVTKLHPLVRRQAIQGGHCGLLVLLGGQLRGDLLIAIQHLLVGVSPGRMPLIIAVDKVLLVLLLAAQNVLQKAHHILAVMHTSGCTLVHSAGTSAALVAIKQEKHVPFYRPAGQEQHAPSS
jgi:hypothetical protein